VTAHHLSPVDRAMLRVAMAWCRITQTRPAAALAAWWHRPVLAHADRWAGHWAADPAYRCSRPDCARCYGDL